MGLAPHPGLPASRWAADRAGDRRSRRRGLAEAINSAVGLDTIDGLSLCLRLLALVEVLGRAQSLAAFFAVTPAGIDLHPSLLSAAAAMPARWRRPVRQNPDCAGYHPARCPRVAFSLRPSLGRTA